MKYVIIAFCLVLIALAIWLFIRHVKKMSKGGCCGDCAHCSLYSEQCGRQPGKTPDNPEDKTDLKS